MAEKDKSICAVTAAMTGGPGLNEFSQKFSDRFFDVGIAEAHAVTFSSALAKGGLKPYFAVYSSFLQRSYDQIIHDAAIASLPLRLLVDRAGLVGEDGKTHHGLFDLSFLSSLPGMTVYSPASFDELENTIKNTAEIHSPVAGRYGRGSEAKKDVFPYTGEDFDVIKQGNDTVLLTFGRLSFDALDAAEDTGCTFIKLNKVYPVSDDLITLLSKYKKVSIFEEGIRSGGIGEKIISRLALAGFCGKVTLNAVNDDFVETADLSSQLKKCGLCKDTMIGVIS